MSISAMVAVRDYSTRKGPHLLLLLMIADVINDSDYNSARNCSLELLCRRARIDRRNAKRYLIDLVQSGELVTEIIPGKTNVYSIPILEGEDGYAPEKCFSDVHDCSGFHTPLKITRDKNPRPSQNKKPRQQRYGKRIGRGNITPTPAPSLDGGVVEPLHGGVVEPLHDANLPLHGGVVEPLRSYPLLSQVSSLIDPNARMRASEPSSSEEILEETGKEAEASSPPTPPPPPGKEERAIWMAVQRHMASRGVNFGQLTVMKGAHLYKLGRGMWRVYVPRGYDTSKFRARYEDLITDALSTHQRAGNQIVEFAS